MKTRDKLNAAYKKALQVEIDNNSRLVFISDTHRGDDSLSDEFSRNKQIFYHALSHYYRSGFTYIEVGDGDELWEQRHFEIIRNAHFRTFEMLKKFYNDGRMYMLYGNHNIQLKNPKYVEDNYYYVYDEYLGEKTPVFPGLKVYEALRMKNKDTGQELFVLHGHQGDLFNDQLHFFSLFIIRFLWRFLHLIGVRYAATPAKSRRRMHRVEKRYKKWSDMHDTLLICGHTHRPRFPDPEEGAYFNTGCGMHPQGITALEIENGSISLVTWRISTKADGMMYVKRTVLKGPRSLTDYVAKH